MKIVISKTDGNTDSWLLRNAGWESEPVSYEITYKGIQITEGKEVIRRYPFSEIKGFKVTR